jgi:hypothetical protein
MLPRLNVMEFCSVVSNILIKKSSGYPLILFALYKELFFSVGYAPGEVALLVLYFALSWGEGLFSLVTLHVCI